MTNGDVVSYLNIRAPFDTAEPWDNVGLLVGTPEQPVHGILVTLDATEQALQAANAVGANLIVTHHPVIFDPLTQVNPNAVPVKAVLGGCSVLSVHTNLDKADGGVNDTLAQLLGLTDIRKTENGMCRVGTLPAPTDPVTLAHFVGETLDTAVRFNGTDSIRTVAVCGGSGGDFIDEMRPLADAYITGEVKHHQWLTADGITVIEAGHYATEVPVVNTLCQWLKEAFPSVPVTPFWDAAPYLTVK